MYVDDDGRRCWCVVQRCVRETTSSLTRFINAFDDARGRRRDVDTAQRRQRARRSTRLWRRAADDCTAVADRALPPLVEALRAIVTRPTSLSAHLQLINAASDAVKVTTPPSIYSHLYLEGCGRAHFLSPTTCIP